MSTFITNVRVRKPVFDRGPLGQVLPAIDESCQGVPEGQTELVNLEQRLANFAVEVCKDALLSPHEYVRHTIVGHDGE